MSTANDLLAQTTISVRRSTLQGLAEELIARKPRSLPDIRSTLHRHVLPALGQRVPAELSPLQVRRFLETVPSPQIAAKSGWVIGLLWDVAFERGEVDDPTPPTPKGRRPRLAAYDWDSACLDVLTPAEVARLSRDTRIESYRRDFWTLAALTGARVSELAGANFRHVIAAQPLAALLIEQQQHQKLRELTDTKTGVPRRIPLHLEAYGAVRRCRARYHALLGRDPLPDEPLLLYKVRDRAPARWYQEIALKYFKQDLETLGIRPRTLHKARHTFVSLLGAAGVDPQVISIMTHPPRRPRTSFEGYFHLNWQFRCEQVARIALPPVSVEDPDGQLWLQM